MVKGNWERRAELAALRRTAQKEVKADKKAGIKKVSPEAASNKLLAGDSFLQDAIISAWLSEKRGDADPETSAGMLCTAHIRKFEGCELKRCRLFHAAVTVGHLRGLQSGHDEGAEVLLEPPTPLKAVRPVDYPRIRFLSVDGRCVYDWARADQWSDYSAEMDSQRSCLKMCETVAEVSLAGAEGEEADGTNGEGEEGPGQEKMPHLQLAMARQPDVLLHCSALLALLDLVHLSEVSCSLRRAVQGAPELRRRLKEGRSAVTAALARKKVAEKRKKQRNAHIASSDKVDGFARGGNGYG